MYVFKNLPDVLMYYSDILSTVTCVGESFLLNFFCRTGFSKRINIFPTTVRVQYLFFFYLVEVSPAYDLSGNTSLTAANLLFEMICVLRL